MPTPEEIKKIAREYAENVKSECVSAKLIETLVMGFYHTRLKNDYCIVPKEDVIDLYEAHRNESRGLEKGCREWFFYEGRNDLMETLFGKSLFNEEKK